MSDVIYADPRLKGEGYSAAKHYQNDFAEVSVGSTGRTGQGVILIRFYGFDLRVLLPATVVEWEAQANEERDNIIRGAFTMFMTPEMVLEYGKAQFDEGVNIGRLGLQKEFRQLLGC